MQGHWAVADICIPQAHLESHHLSKGAGKPAAERPLLLTVTSRPFFLIPNTLTELSLRGVASDVGLRRVVGVPTWVDDSKEATEEQCKQINSNGQIERDTSGKSIGGERMGAAYQRFHGCA
jgi:hypothetical protein